MNSEGQKKSRRSPRELVEAIMEALPVRSWASVHELAEMIGTNWKTAEEYLRLIQYIQEQPKVECMRTGIRRYGWRRERAK